MPTLFDDLLTGLRLIGLHNLDNVARYPFRKAWAEARWDEPGRPRRGLARWRAFRPGEDTFVPQWPSRWQRPGAVTAAQPHPRGLTLSTAHGTLALTLWAADLAQVRYLPRHGEARPPVPYAIAKPLEAWATPPFEVVETPQAYFLCTPALIVGVLRESAAVFFADATGALLRADVDMGWGATGALRHRTALAAGEYLYGLGEKATPANRRGRQHILWNTDPAGYAPGDEPINLNIPVYVGRHAAGDYLVFYENPTYGVFDLGATLPELADHRFQGGELRYYFGVGEVPALLERYTELTGRHRLQPLWMLGYQQSRWSYDTEARVRKLADDFAAHEVPCDAIHLDIDYLDGFRNFTWDRERFPNFPGMVADLRAQGIKIVSIVDAGVKQDPAYPAYRTGLAGRHFCTLPNGEVFHAPVWPGMCGFPDFTSAPARAWWGEQYRPLIEAGVAGFWNDMNEPLAFSAQGPLSLPTTLQHTLERRGGDHREAHNLYGMLMARASTEGVQRLSPDKRPVVITRAGWAGVQRHATSWTGDNESTWGSLRVTVPVMLGLGLSGLGFSGPDVGGFAGEADGELFTRWAQLGAFMPFFRAHTMAGTPDQEPWSYGEPFLSIVRRFIQLRYELLPYLYTALWQMTTRGWPMVRPVWWGAPYDPALLAVDDAFLCGDALLVAPVGEPGATQRDVRLPGGNWYDFWTNRRREGEAAFVQVAPLETLPLFVRAGTVLPLGEFGPSVEQRVDKFLRLNLYPLAADGAAVSWLYEDAGEGLAYQDGEQRVSRFVMTREGQRLTVTWEREGAYVPPYEHIALTLLGLPRLPEAVLADGEAYRVLMADAVQHTAVIAVPPFERLEIML